MTLAHHAEARSSAADAQQAAYFRAALVAERDLLTDTVIAHRPVDERSLEGGAVSTWHVRRAEAEVRYIDRLIAGLDRRFAAQWAVRR